MKISVTQADIKDGRPCESEECPIALAIRRADVSIQVARVGADEIEVKRNGYWESIETPGFINDFIEAFDADETVLPFDAELPI